MMPDKKWITEISERGFRLQYEVKKTLYSKQSQFQKVEVIENDFFGKMLFNDDIVMITEKDEYIYHEMIAHVPLFTHPSPRKILVIGGGDGGTVREVLKHSSVEKVTLVEIDSFVVDACKKFIPSVSSEIDNPRCEFICADAARFIEETDRYFDIILIDSTDPQGASLPLFGENFYKDLSKKLTSDGIVVCQAESPYLYEKEQKNLLDLYNKYFSNVYLYKYYNMSYPLGFWSFAMGSQKHSPLSSETLDRSTQRTFESDYYTTAIHRDSFVLPAFLQRRLNERIKNIFP